MNSTNFKIIFMGTPEFAVTILDSLIQNNFDVVGVVTTPDKPAGRGQKIAQSDVKKYSEENGLHTLQPSNLKDESFIAALKALEADLFVVVAFRMLPEIVWNMPPQGTINLHASLLPQYRGAAPINWAIVNGEKKTGVTTFFIEKEIDTGMIIEQQEVEIGENDTAGELHDELMHVGSKLVVQTVQKIQAGEVVRTPQNDLILGQNLNEAPKIFKPMCEINWKEPVEVVHNFCRGFSPYPTAWTKIENKNTGEVKSLKIFKTVKTDQIVSEKEKIESTKEGLLFPCGDFYLLILEIQPEGKRRMTAKEFNAGHKIEDWKLLE
ncbi:MAG: methionyl-tRNA formyltransferase [Crocinitomicaceae bacterium]|nr:methionyl-tRNA formyltransferase [Crocinitomicaceae bacterium]